MTMITPSYLGETIEYSSLHACRSTLEDPTSISCAQELNELAHERWVIRPGARSYQLIIDDHLLVHLNGSCRNHFRPNEVASSPTVLRYRTETTCYTMAALSCK